MLKKVLCEVSGYGAGRNGKDLSKIQVIYKWAKTDNEVLYYQKEIDALDENVANLLRPQKLDSTKDNSEEISLSSKHAPSLKNIDKGFEAGSSGIDDPRKIIDSEQAV